MKGKPIENTIEQAKTVSLRLLSYRARSRAELQQRLEKKGFSTGVIRQTLADLQRIGLIDDPEFARMWVEGRIRSRPVGAATLRWELRRKGIDENLAAETVQQALKTKDEFAIARELAQTRWKRMQRSAGTATGAPDRNDIARLGRFLTSRGFSYQIIRDVIRIISGPEAADESLENHHAE